MSRHENQFAAMRASHALIEQFEKGEVTIEQLQARFRAIKQPEAGVIKLSPAESFTVESGAFRVTDPCYDADTWCAGTLEGVKNGDWVGFVGAAVCESDMGWAKKWANEKIENLASGLVDDDEIRRIFQKPGETLDAENIERLRQFHRNHAMRDKLEWLLEYEDSLSGEVAGRVNYLHVHHADHPIVDMDDTWEQSEIDVGVDSGQAGFIDLNWFLGNQVAEGVDKHNNAAWEKFYGLFCDKTLNTDFSFGCLEHAAVSSSGYGDGSYTCYFKRDEQGQVIAARIVYIGDYEEEGEE